MQSLTELCALKLSSMSLRRELSIGPSRDLTDYIGVVPNDVLSLWTASMQTELKETKRKLIEAKVKLETAMFSCFSDQFPLRGALMDPESNKRALKYVEDSHKWGFCQEIFPNRCHLCYDNVFCLLCWGSTDPLSGNLLQCTLCYAKHMEKTALWWGKDAELSTEECTKDPTSLSFCCCSSCGRERAEECRKVGQKHKEGICECGIFVGSSPHLHYPLN